jgi:excisionase family DNA binding protein
MPIKQPDKIIKIGKMTLYSGEYIADKLGVTMHTVCAMLRKGTIKGHKMGGKWFVSEKAIKEYFN